MSASGVDGKYELEAEANAEPAGCKGGWQPAPNDEPAYGQIPAPFGCGVTEDVGRFVDSKNLLDGFAVSIRGTVPAYAAVSFTGG